MLVFLKKVIFFTLPLLLLFAVPAFVIYEGREYFSVKDVVETQLQYPESIFGFAYNDVSFYPYKEALVKIGDPKVIALGTSRIMQLREEFFTKETKFINAGGAGKSLSDMERFLNDLPAGSSSQVIILGLDAELFTQRSVLSTREEQLLPVRFVSIVISMSRRIYLDYLTNKLNIQDVHEANTSSNNIGLSGLLLQNGFRSDGSYQYAGAKRDANRLSYIEEQFKQSASLIKSNKDKNRDEELAHVEENIKILERILNLAEKKGITTIGLMPPYPSLVYKELLRSDELFPVVAAKVSDVFKSKQVPLFDFSSIQTFGGKDTEFVDGIHGTDLMYLKMMMYLQDSKVLEGYTNEALLENLEKKAQKDFLGIK